MNEVTFKDRVKEYFGQQSDEFLCLMKEKPSQAFFLNEKKADRKIILSLIDFEIKESPLSDQSFYYEHEN